MLSTVEPRCPVHRRRSVSIYLWAVVVLLWLAGCGSRERPSTADEPTRQPGKLRIAAASDLKFALDEVIAAYAIDHRDIRIEPTYGSSGNLYAQLTNQAPFDMFLSADIGYPRKLIDAGLADRQSEFFYGNGKIVIWATKSANLDVSARGLASLTDPAVQKITIANPAHAPYGRAAEAALRSLGVYDAVKDHLVLGENIAQAAQFVESGAAQLGIIALSLALAPAMRDRGDYWLVPVDAYPKLEQGGVIVSGTSHREAAEAFRRYLIDKPARDILARYGFELPEE